MRRRFHLIEESLHAKTQGTICLRTMGLSRKVPGLRFSDKVESSGVAVAPSSNSRV